MQRWNSSWAISNPKRWCCKSAALNIPANLENSAGATGLEKVSFPSNPKERQCQRMLKLRTIALISYASQVMLKILQARLQKYMNHEVSHVQAGFRKGTGTRDQIANICRITEKEVEFPKSSISASLIVQKPLCGSQQTVKYSSRDGNTRPPYLSPEESVCKSRSNS